MYSSNQSSLTEIDLGRWTPPETYVFQLWSVFKTLGSPTTISKACARVIATLNLWEVSDSVHVSLSVNGNAGSTTVDTN